MIHCTNGYDPPQYRIACTGKWVTPDFDKDVAPLDDIFIATDGTKYSPEVQYSNCPKCLDVIRNEDLALEPDPEE